MTDLFDKLSANKGPLSRSSDRFQAEGYFFFPKLEGVISNRMTFKGNEMIIWSINNYLGLANHPEVREADAKAAEEWGLAYPMGARMLTGNTAYHEQLEKELSEFVHKEDTILLNYGYQGMVSSIHSLLNRWDVVIYDSDAHGCIVDGVHLHAGKRFVYPHNNIEKLEKQLQRAEQLVKDTDGAILVITEGVFGMAGDQGCLKQIVALKKRYQFRFFVDDAHGFGTVGQTGAGTGEEQGVQDEIDIYFSTFAKSMASIGAFISSDKCVIDHLRYNNRSQMLAKSLPLPIVIGNLKRLELLRNCPELREKLWDNVRALQSGLRARGFNLGRTDSPVTPVFMNCTMAETWSLTVDLRETYKIFCSVIIYPVVPKDVLMLRMIPTAVHTKEDIEETLDAFSAVQEKLKAGEYAKEELVKV
ncbi:MAG: aminotransferase class I/II-fold pyridoxal phosphate-dependent enzyme [Bacteroidetes bacterium]|nr:aminotransferase class I/II-fold pyridoxal phosphate-dependent enzyme [Bacteroidota bacterium]